MRSGEIGVWISQLANMWGVFCRPVDISSISEDSQLNTTTLHSRTNSANYKNAFTSISNRKDSQVYRKVLSHDLKLDVVFLYQADR